MNREAGYSIVELLTVVLIVAILLAIGVPSYRYVGSQNRMSMEVNSLLGDLQYARSEALRQGKNVTACVSTDGATCTGGTAWGRGWVVYANPNAAANPPVGSILRVRTAFIGVTPDVFTSNNAVSSLTFNREGFATTAAGFVTTKFLLTEQSNSNAYTRCLLASPVGVLTTQTRTGSPATC